MGFALVLEEKLNVLSKGECVDKERKKKKLLCCVVFLNVWGNGS